MNRLYQVKGAYITLINLAVVFSVPLGPLLFGDMVIIQEGLDLI